MGEQIFLIIAIGVGSPADRPRAVRAVVYELKAANEGGSTANATAPPTGAKVKRTGTTVYARSV